MDLSIQQQWVIAMEAISKSYDAKSVDGVRMLIDRLASESPDQLIRLIEAERLFAGGDPQWLDVALSALIRTRPGELDDIGKKIGDLHMRSQFIRAAVRVFSKDGKWDEAEALLEKQAPGTTTAARYSELALLMCQKNIDLAVSLLDRVDFPEGHSAVVSQLVSSLGDEPDPLPHVEKMLALAGHQKRDVEALARIWARSKAEVEATPEKLMDSIRNLQIDESTKISLVRASGLAILEKTPTSDMANEWLAHMPADVDISGFGAATTSLLARKNITEATSFVTSLSEKQGAGLAMQSLLSYWMENDSLAASGWVSGLPTESPHRSSAVRYLVEYLRRVGDNEAANQWEKSLR